MTGKEDNIRRRTKTRHNDEEIALVPCDPYVVLGHVKARSIPLLSWADDPTQDNFLVEPQVDLNVTIANLPVSERIKHALFNADSSSVFVDMKGEKYLKFAKEAKIRKGEYVFLTICSFRSDDIRHPDAEFLTWTPEEELVRYQGGKDACVAYTATNNLTPTVRIKKLTETYSATALRRILDVHSQRMRAAHLLLNDKAAFIPYAGAGYILGKGPARKMSDANRDRAVRAFHRDLAIYRESKRKEYQVRNKTAVVTTAAHRRALTKAEKQVRALRTKTLRPRAAKSKGKSYKN